MHDKVMIAGQAGSGGPDIADIEISQFGRFIKGEVIFADLTPRLEKIGALNNLYRPSATDPWSWKGRVYGLGNELNTCLLSYRWDIWKKAGVRTPIKTWDEFVDQARRYHRDTGKYLIDFPFNDWGSWWMLTLQEGGGFFGPDGQLTFDSPKGLKTLAFMQNAIKDGWATLRLPAMIGAGAGTAETTTTKLLPTHASANTSGRTSPNDSRCRTVVALAACHPVGWC